jgi:hypothetical protein
MAVFGVMKSTRCPFHQKLTSGLMSRWINPCLWHDSIARIIYTTNKLISRSIGEGYGGGKNAHLSNVEAGEILLKNVSFNQEIKEIAASHVFKYLN